MKGTVKRWLKGRGYGFIEPEDGGDYILVHNSEVKGIHELREGQKVVFEVQRTFKGPRAINVNIVE